MKKRASEPFLLDLASHFPAVVITGPRQSGKTTLARKVFPDKPYLSLENPDIREHVQHDPRDFLRRHRAGAILDEIQNTPELLSYLQEVLDEPGAAMGRFVLTGSRQFSLMERLTQSLAGRVGLLSLLPFTWNECYGKSLSKLEIDDLLYRGLFPPVDTRAIPPHLWYAGYVQTYLERDVRNQLNIHDLSAFQRFIRLCAGRTGQLVNRSQLAADAGITHNTAKAWLSVLEAAGLIFMLHPHYANFNKRLTKNSKLYFCDTGLVCWLLGIEGPAQVGSHALRGALFENAVIVEVLKRRLNAGRTSNLFFWRDQSGTEIDLLEENNGRLTPTEIKSGATFSEDWVRNLNIWTRYAGELADPGRIIYGGDRERSVVPITVLPWYRL